MLHTNNVRFSKAVFKLTAISLEKNGTKSYFKRCSLQTLKWRCPFWTGYYIWPNFSLMYTTERNKSDLFDSRQFGYTVQIIGCRHLTNIAIAIGIKFYLSITYIFKGNRYPWKRYCFIQNYSTTVYLIRNRP